MQKLSIIIYLIVAVLISSCSQEDIYEENSPISESANIEFREGISPDINILEASDAMIVAKMFANGNPKSRSENNTIVNTVTIPGYNNEPILYAVNYKNGYVIVSATKNLPPIVAIVDNGHFSLNETPSGRDIILSHIINEAEYWLEQGGNNKHKDEWKLYTKKKTHPRKPLSRADIQSDPWMAMYAQLYEFEDMGHECYRISILEDDQDVVPEDILNRYKRSARYEDNIWEDEYGEELMYETALLVIKQLPSNVYGGYCIKTKWAQEPPYNFLLSGNNKLGCTTITIGQIMKYHKFPAAFNWDNMPDVLDQNAGDCTLTRFLKIIHDKLGVNYLGEASIKKCIEVLESYGYSIKAQPHKSNTYLSYPAFCYGYDSTADEAHTWICDGSQYSTSYQAYELYVFDNAYYPNFKYMKINEETTFQTSRTLYHMNLGWGGVSDGYYMDSYINVKNKKGNYYLNEDRVDLFISK